MIRTRILISAFSTSLQQYLSPYSLRMETVTKMPTISLKSEKLLLKDWWSSAPFETNHDLKVPVFNFLTNQFSGKSVELPQQIFNQPLRRDLIYKLHQYRSKLNKFRTKMTRNRAMTAGSGAKMRGQKKSGRARMGDKRAPHLRKGGKIHGAKPVVYSINMNSKMKLKALCSLLTSKLVEGKIRIVDEEKIQEPKTKALAKVLKGHIQDERTVLCIITSTKVDENFSFAHRNIDRVIWHDTYSLDVKSLFIADKIYITLQGLQELINNIRKTKYIIYRQPYMPEIEEKNEKSEQIIKWDPQKPYEFKFKILAQYLDLYEKVKKTTPHLLSKQLNKIRKVQSL